jgi:hypothetical protein
MVVVALLGVRQCHLLPRGGKGPSLRVGVGHLHGGGGGARHGPVKRRPPCEAAKMARSDSVLHGGG